MTAPAVLSQQAAATAPLRSVGAKAATLARLAAAGVPVPSFYVVPSDAFGLHLSQNRIPWPSSTAETGGSCSWTRLRDLIRQSPMEPTLGEQILEAYERLCSISGHRRVAVRSSGSDEDSRAASFAGQFSSFGNLEAPDLRAALKDCWASYVSDRSIRYRIAKRLPLGPFPSFGVIVQIQVFSERAGVAFTVHPLEAARGVAYIEANFGTGESVVAGLATPDSVTVSRASADVLETVIATKRRMTVAPPESSGTKIVEVDESLRASAVLTDGEVRELFQMSMSIERIMQTPQDVEWAYDSHQLWALQARPITVLSGDTT